jgi:cell division protein FtsZ
VTSAADQNANVIFGAVIDDALKDEVRVTVIATGFGAQRRRRPRTREAPVQEEADERRPGDEGFDVPEDVLDVPSFLRE